MSLRQNIGEVSLWVALLLVGIIIGASVYQRISLIPEWGGNLPDSVGTYFQGTTNAAAIGRFWENALPPTAIMVVLTLLTNWPERSRRKWLIVGAIFFFAMLAWTAIYFVPSGVIPLMVRAGAGLSGDEITRRARAWIFWDWFRMAGTAAAYFSLLKALTYRPLHPHTLAAE